MLISTYGLSPLQFFNVLGEVGYSDLAQTLPGMRDHFAPLFVNDHIVAL